jgi:SAM-dependent methyltransferase
MNTNLNYQSIVKHYEDCLEMHGDTHKGMDWPKLEDVDKRYRVMLELILFHRKNNEQVKLLDFGCGTSHFYSYIKDQGIDFIKYSGLDISENPVAISKSKFPENDYYVMDLMQNDQLPVYDYIVMNGVFTEKVDLSFEEMFDYFKQMIRKAFAKAEKGIAFNVMSKAVDWEREDLFHLPTDLLISFLTKEISRDFIIRNDYGLYEYTTYVYKN